VATYRQPNSRLLAKLAEAALDRQPVTGWTHNFYRYPARFSPKFAAAAIESFSRPGDLILDPYMGGGTAVVEALAHGRRAVGNDLNSLATFIARVKTTALEDCEIRALRCWADSVVPGLSYSTPHEDVEPFIDATRTRNLNLPCARFIKKVIAAALGTIGRLPTASAREFARCAILRAGQWALDWRNGHASVQGFRVKLAATAHEMLDALVAFVDRVRQSAGRRLPEVHLLNKDAAEIHQAPIFEEGREKASLVVTSPPYPGVHVLYHRWQVDGRRETPAPYWIANCEDGETASFYNFGDRRESGLDAYFKTSLATLLAVRRVMACGAFMVQMIAFSDPDSQLPRYLENMRIAGFCEVLPSPAHSERPRIWRDVPRRKWHASINGKTHSSREAVLVHQAV